MSDFLSNLPRHLRIGLQLGAVVAMIFLILIGYAARTAPRMARESEATLDAFYRRCQQRSYARAYQLLAPELKYSMSEAEMQARFEQFEKTNGKIERWAPAAGGSITFGGRVCLFPPFVDYTHRLMGVQKKEIGEATVVYLRLVPRDGKWRIQKLSFMR